MAQTTRKGIRPEPGCPVATHFNIHFIPMADSDTLIETASKLSVAQIDKAFGPKVSIDAAVAKIMSMGDQAERLGVCIVNPEDVDADFLEDLPFVNFQLDLKNFGDEYPDYAAHYYGTPKTLPPLAAVRHTILNGELDGHAEAFLSTSTHWAKSPAYEAGKREDIDIAYREVRPLVQL